MSLGIVVEKVLQLLFFCYNNIVKYLYDGEYLWKREKEK